MASRYRQVLKWTSLGILLLYGLLFVVHHGRHGLTSKVPTILLIPQDIVPVTAAVNRTPTTNNASQSIKGRPENNSIAYLLAQHKSNVAFVIDNENSFAKYDLHNPPIFHLKNDTTKYFTDIGEVTCLIIGTNLEETYKSKVECRCNAGWYGKWCSFPEVLKHSNIGDISKLTIRKEPRRLISATPFNIEFELTESRLADLGNVTDVFMITESVYSGHGDKKPLRLYEKLQKGYLKEWHHKMVYVYLDYFPKAAYKNGWIADDLPRDHIGMQGMKNQIRGVRHDDIFFLFDTDEIPSRDAMLFFKVHDGYPEPFGFSLWKTTYGFFWRGGSGDWPMMGGATVGMLGHVFEYKASKLRNPAGHLPKLGINLRAYLKAGANVKMWKMGSRDHYAGWHCSWCFPVEGIRIKLVSAINADFPRWGDYPEKQDLGYIQGLVRKGMWFDNKGTMTPVKPSYEMYATPHITKNWNTYRYLLENPYS